MTNDVIQCQTQGSCIAIGVGRDGVLDDAGNIWANIVCELVIDTKLEHEHYYFIIELYTFNQDDINMKNIRCMQQHAPSYGNHLEGK
jgi:hypothetical protein